MTVLRSLTLGLIGVMVVLAASECGAAEPAPSLLGTWQSTFKMGTRKGISTAEGTLKFTEQNGHLFRGTFSWKIDPTTGVRADVGGRVGQQGTEEVLGLFHWDNRTVSMSDAGDKGYWSGKLIGTDTLRLIYVESQRHAIAFRATFVRKAASDPTK